MNVVGIVQTVHAVNLRMVFVKTVILEFVSDVNQDKQKTGNPDGQANDIQEGIIEMFQDIPDGNGNQMSEHGEFYNEYGVRKALQMPYQFI